MTRRILVALLGLGMAVLTGCGGNGESSTPTTVTRPAARPTITTRPRLRRSTTTVRTDPRYGSCAEAKAHGYGPYTAGDPEFSWYEDRDGDGIVCEGA